MLLSNWSRSPESQASHTYFFTRDNVNIFRESDHKSSDLVTYRSSSISTEDRERKKAKKNPVPLPPTPKDPAKDSKLHKRSSGETQESSKEPVKSKDPRKHKKSSGKHTEHPHFEKVTISTL